MDAGRLTENNVEWVESVGMRIAVEPRSVVVGSCNRARTAADVSFKLVNPGAERGRMCLHSLPFGCERIETTH